MIIDCGCTRDSRSGRLHRALFGPAPPRRAMRARDEQAHFRRLLRDDQAALAPQTGHRSCPRTHAGGYEREVGSAHGTCRPAAVCARTRAYARGCGHRAPSAPYFAGWRADLARGISIAIVCSPLSAVATTPASRATCCTPVVGTSRARAWEGSRWNSRWWSVGVRGREGRRSHTLTRSDRQTRPITSK